MTDTMIGSRLKELREEHNYTQKQVADYLNIDQSNYSKIELGKRKLRKLSQVHKLCNLYDCTEEYILCKTDEHTNRKWTGVNSKTDLNIIATANETMKYLRMLRQIQRRNMQ